MVNLPSAEAGSITKDRGSSGSSAPPDPSASQLYVANETCSALSVIVSPRQATVGPVMRTSNVHDELLEEELLLEDELLEEDELLLEEEKGISWTLRL